MQPTAEVIGVEANAEVLNDHLGDSKARPWIGWKARSHGPAKEELLQPHLVLWLEPDRAAGNRPSL